MKSQKIQTVEFVLTECKDYPTWKDADLVWNSEEYNEKLAKECGKIEGENIYYGDYYTRFYDEYVKTGKFEAVMYYNDEVF